MDKVIRSIFWVPIFIFAFIAFYSLEAAAAGPTKPFPQHTVYPHARIKPTVDTQAQMDDEVRKQWNTWKQAYLKPAGTGKYYVKYDSSGATTSEAHGYGMLLTVLMAGYDPDAKTYFDGLYQYYKEHPTKSSPYLMAWKQNSQFKSVEGTNSATDGDLDIAFSLLLADKQWGSEEGGGTPPAPIPCPCSNGTMLYTSAATPYKEAAKNIINAIMEKEVNKTAWTLKLGDWASSTDASTRPSDFMLDYLRAFKKATNDARWDNVLNSTYTLIDTMRQKYSPQTGLLPDFIVKNRSGAYAPASPNFLEGSNDGNYYYNSCRTPWRIPTDYLLNGDVRALGTLEIMNNWVKSSTKNKPSAIRAGYKLNGSALSGSDYSSAAFYAPFGVSAMISSNNQDWLNALWLQIRNSKSDGYFRDSIKILSTIIISGNWWQP
jgi:hypothetical protein